MLTSERSSQQPTTKKKERPSVKPSCKERASTTLVQVTSSVNDQDVEMPNAADDQRVDKASQARKPAFSRDDPIES